MATKCGQGVLIALCWLAFAAAMTLALYHHSAPSDPRQARAAQSQALSLLNEPRFRPPPGWSWHHFQSTDGTWLRFGLVRKQAVARGTIVIIPGFQAPIEDFFETVRDFSGRGYDVWSYDLRGQGGSQRALKDPQKTYSTGFEQDETDLVRFVDKFVHAAARGPIFIVAQSLGAHIAIRALHDHPGLVRAAALSSPAIAFGAGTRPGSLSSLLRRASSYFAVSFGFGQSYAIDEGGWQFDPAAGGSHDPVRDDPDRALASEAWQLRDPFLRLGGKTWAYIDARFRSSALENDPTFLRAVSTPILMAAARDDDLTYLPAITAACSTMSSCTLLKYPSAKHALLSDTDTTRKPLMAAIFSFFAAEGCGDARGTCPMQATRQEAEALGPSTIEGVSP
jgi:lysophospholipase